MIWYSTDPRVELIDRKRADLVLLRPSSSGFGWEAGMGQAEMKHGWVIFTSFKECGGSVDDWCTDWRWALAPTPDGDQL